MFSQNIHGPASARTSCKAVHLMVSPIVTCFWAPILMLQLRIPATGLVFLVENSADRNPKLLPHMKSTMNLNENRSSIYDAVSKLQCHPISSSLAAGMPPTRFLLPQMCLCRLNLPQSCLFELPQLPLPQHPNLSVQAVPTSTISDTSRTRAGYSGSHRLKTP